VRNIALFSILTTCSAFGCSAEPVQSSNYASTPVGGAAASSALGGTLGIAGRGTALTAGTSGGVAGRGAVSGVAGRPGTPFPAGSAAPIGSAGTSAPIAGRGAPAGAAGSSPVPPAAGSVAPPVGGAPSPGEGDRATAAGVCARWKGDRADLSEGTWSGNVASCDPGDISENGRANALRVLNLYRWLADMPPVTTDPTMDKQAQACALLQKANNSLSHTPPMTWTCYMAEGATAAGRCNISTGPGVQSVDGYMVDPGNDTTIGHRRWILSNSFGPTGLGSTDRHSCMMTFGKSKVGKPWMAWPSPGIIPVQAMTPQRIFRTSVDATGWTIQSDTINLASAQVTVTSAGADKAVAVQQLGMGYGSRYAISFKPQGWQSTAGQKYAVAVTGISTPINYEVEFVDCP